ncbi:MAG TPA: type III-B CRISPR module RAMP protein Cmr6, partial [Porticoccaceae bacterium]
MPIAAVPGYLADKNFSTASPGLRFGMYLQLWGIDERTREVLWTTHDRGYEVRGPDKLERSVRRENKVPALKAATRLNANDKATMQALLRRQQQVFAAQGTPDASLVLEAQAVAPFTTGLGNEHPLENGFAFLNPYGLPYLPGSGVKGVLRQAARELASGDWGESHGWNEAAIVALFGTETGAEQLTRGALVFWDVIPQVSGDALSVEIMTPHQKHYYQDNQSPHDCGQPTPISFLTVPPESGFTFHVQCNLTLLKRFAPDLAESDRWKDMLRVGFEHAFAWLGFGAKTSVGYGAMVNQQMLASRKENEIREKLKESGIQTGVELWSSVAIRDASPGSG